MKVETKVGLTFIIAIVMTVAFAYFLGVINPFANNYELNLAYNYAGGIEVGSPVRVMGIKVGKVKSISFDPNQKMPSGEEVKLRITITIDKGAWETVREDSQFFINLAGVIGEKFIEISPGSSAKEKFVPGALVRGEDPPRIDQLISQSYGLAGKVIDMLNRNEGSISDTINTINKLVGNLNGALKQLDSNTKGKDINKMVTNFIQLTDDIAYFTNSIRQGEGEKTVKLVNRLLWRLDDLDAKAIRKFLQEEGIKAKMF